MDKTDIAERFRDLQSRICSGLEELDGLAKFSEDNWEREEGGGGLTRVIANGGVFEKGGVNFSEVYGPLSEPAKAYLKVKDDNFYATGVSIVIHPESPLIPIIHMNVRYFELDGGTYWFGGGIDLTPIYIEEARASEFHQAFKTSMRYIRRLILSPIQAMGR